MVIENIYTLLFIVSVVLLITAGSIRIIKAVKPGSGRPQKTPHITIHTDKLYMGESGIPETLEKTIIPGQVFDKTASQPDHSIQKKTGDKRGYPRKKINAVVDFVINGKLFKENAVDYSRSGIFLKSFHPASYAPDDLLTLTFQTINGKPHKHMGKIVRKSSQGVGVQFVNA